MRKTASSLQLKFSQPKIARNNLTLVRIRGAAGKQHQLFHGLVSYLSLCGGWSHAQSGI